MLTIIIKYTVLILCCLQLYMKLQNINPPKFFYLYQSLTLPVILLPLYLIRIYVASCTILFIITLLSIFMSRFFKIPLNFSLTVMSISFGIVYFLFIVASLLVAPIGCFLDIYLNNDTSDIVSMICIGLVQFLFISLIFRFHRFKNGMTFLNKNTSSDIGFYISISILITASFFSLLKKSNSILIIPLFFTLLNGGAIFFCWKNNLTKKYIQNLKDIEIKDLQNEILAKNQEIEKLKHHNDELSRIIHKDNKLIPSMEYAVKKYLLYANDTTSNDQILIQGQQLLKQLDKVTRERSSVLYNYEIKGKKLALSGIPSVDTLFSFMYQKATKYNIKFDISLSENTNRLVKDIISESDLRTLLADLIDNAIIASKKASSKKIFINLKHLNPCSFIDIFDSGEPFHTDVLLNIGIKRLTTHAHEGGSGIGLMTTFDIINKYRASFIIEEFEENELFTKKVSILFDNLNQIHLKTTRSGIKDIISKRDDFIIVEKVVYQK